MKNIILFFMFSFSLYAQSNLLLLSDDDNLLSTLKSIPNVVYYGDYNTVVKDANNKVTQLTALIGSTNIVQADTSKAPTFTTDGLFFTTDDFMTGNGLATFFTGDDKPMTVIVVAKGSATNDSYQYWSFGSSVSNADITGARIASAVYQVNRKTATFNMGTTNTNEHTVTFIMNGAVGSVYVDGTALQTDGDYNVDALSIDKFSLGCYGRPANSLFFKGYIKQVIIIARAITDTERLKIEKFL